MKLCIRDFDNLYCSAAHDKAHSIRDHIREGRFLWVNDDLGLNAIRSDLEYFYFFEEYSAVLFARQYLEENGHLFQVLIDVWAEDNNPPYVINTNLEMRS